MPSQTFLVPPLVLGLLRKPGVTQMKPPWVPKGIEARPLSLK